MTSKTDDERHMRHALRLAERAMGRVAPNPAVGCVIVSEDGKLAGRGWTAPGGRPHAETIALAQAGKRARGATAYVTLEPCAHHGMTPPCADALIASGVARVVAAIADPDPRVDGTGLAKLENAGVAVTRDVCEREARALNAGFFLRIRHQRPLVALKSAESADGFVAPSGSGERWITSDEARRHGHLLRAKHDAILIGIGTALADDPLLTCRLAGMEDRTPLRIVLDSGLRLPPGSQLARTARQYPVLAVTASDSVSDALTASGVEILRVDGDMKGRPAIIPLLHALASRGITRILVEGGPEVQRSFIAAGAADMVYRYRAPHALGTGLLGAVSDLVAGAGSPVGNVEVLEPLRLGPDLLETYRING